MKNLVTKLIGTKALENESGSLRIEMYHLLLIALNDHIIYGRLFEYCGNMLKRNLLIIQSRDLRDGIAELQ